MSLFFNILSRFVIAFLPRSQHGRHKVNSYRIYAEEKERKDTIILYLMDFPGSPVVKTLPSNAGGAGLIPGQGAKIPHASQPKYQNIN